MLPVPDVKAAALKAMFDPVPCPVWVIALPRGGLVTVQSDGTRVLPAAGFVLCNHVCAPAPGAHPENVYFRQFFQH